MCGIHDILNKHEPDLNLFSDAEIDAIVLGVYHGTINVNSLDVSTYLRVARKLLEGVFDGYGKTLTNLTTGTTDYIMLNDLKHNIYVFSAAKQYQQVRAMSKQLTTNGKVTPFPEFKIKAKEIFNQYNEEYLKAEYNSAIAQSRSASQWQDIVKQQDQFPMLTYETVGDSRVRPTHAELDHISRFVNDKFWNIYMPPNGWNCRCTVIQDDQTTQTSLRGFKTPQDVPPIFRFNSGKDRIVFSPKHPYFRVAPKDKSAARNNFGMPMP